MSRVLIVLGVLVVIVISTAALREGTETRHVHMPPDSHLVVAASVRTRGTTQAASLASAQAQVCVAETRSSARVTDVTLSADQTLRFEVHPALDEPDRRQLRGCLEDLRVPNLKLGVDKMTSFGIEGIDDE